MHESLCESTPDCIFRLTDETLTKPSSFSTNLTLAHSCRRRFKMSLTFSINMRADTAEAVLHTNKQWYIAISAQKCNMMLKIVQKYDIYSLMLCIRCYSFFLVLVVFYQSNETLPHFVLSLSINLILNQFWASVSLVFFILFFLLLLVVQPTNSLFLSGSKYLILDTKHVIVILLTEQKDLTSTSRSCFWLKNKYKNITKKFKKN